MEQNKKQIVRVVAVIFLAFTQYAAVAHEGHRWENVNAYELEEAELSKFNSENYAFVKYSQLKGQLEEMAKQSNRITLDVKGKSAGGHDMFVVTISDPSAKGKYSHYQALRKQMFNNPEKAQDWVGRNPDFKVPVMINASIHGTEYAGTDAALQLIRRFATQNDATTTSILENNIIIINVVSNPDGRIGGTRFNGNGIDLNRDFITQSQPETKLAVGLMTEWNPMLVLDLHGYVKNFAPNLLGLIEPCTPPHNPNYEYDLFNKWALDQALAMEAEIMADQGGYTKERADLYQSMKGAYIPARDSAVGWDDYPPIFTPMYAMYHGAYGHTLEAPTNDEDGVRWQYNAVIGALKFATKNRTEMMKDQIEIFKRGIKFEHPNHIDGFFPKTYVLPVDETDPTATEKAVKHLVKNGIDVAEAKRSFAVDGETYPAGTYIVNMKQAKAGLANTMLWGGEDISDKTPVMYDISAWSLPELWGFKAIAAQNDVTVDSALVNQTDARGTLVGKGPYLIRNNSVRAVNLVNDLINNGIGVNKSETGDFYVQAQEGNTLRRLVAQAGLTIETAGLPTELTAVEDLKVAILKDGGINKFQSHSGTKLALDRLGFSVTELHPREVAESGLQGYDVFLYSGSPNLIRYDNNYWNVEFWLENEGQLQAFKDNVTSFVENGGKYIAVGAGASQATKALGLTNVNANAGGFNTNGIVKVNYNDSPIAKGYKVADIGFVYQPAWYTNLTDQQVVASYADSEDYLIAGHWRGSSKAEAQGQPVIIKESNQDVTLIGLEAGFRDHTDYLFRLLSNAIFDRKEKAGLYRNDGTGFRVKK